MEILYEDASLLVCVKPAGLISEEAGVPALLREQTGAARILPVHRLDKEAAGLMLCAKTQEAAAALSVPISFASAESVTTPIRYWPKVS